MTPEAFHRWLAEMKAAGLARSDAECARRIGYRDVIRQKASGGDYRLALACRAALLGQEPYE